MDPKLVLFTHVGRTGGDFLINSVQRSLGTNLAVHFDTKQSAWEFLGRCPVPFLFGLKFMAGHGVYYGLHQQIRRPTTYSVLFRDPVDRIISQYYSYLTDPSYEMHKRFVESGITLEQFGTTYRNDHANYILGYGNYRKTLPEICDLNEAIEVLERDYCFVGTTEQWYFSFYLLAQILGITQPPLLGRRRVNENRPALNEVSEGTRDYLAAQNELDLALYRYAQARLERQILALSKEQLSEVTAWTGVFQAAAELSRDLDPELFDHACLQECFAPEGKRVLLVDGLEADQGLSKQAHVLFETLNEKYNCKINLASTIQVETSEPAKTRKILAGLNIESVKQEVDLIVILARAGESYSIRNPLLDAGFPKPRIRCLFREVFQG